ncbi:MAG TPA: TolC family protein [Candidatus Didemnitutus sp.]|nr:TolC family protein [Candidatus Didemnitutus sp.]
MRPKLPTLMLAGLLAAPLAFAEPNPTQEVPDKLDLPTALNFALENNFAIRQAKERIREQEGVVVEVRGAALPNVNASGQYQRNDVEISSNGYDNNWALDVTARQVLFAGGGVAANIKSQKFVLEAAVLSLKDVINNALLDVRFRFYTVLVNRERIKVQEQSVELLQRQLQDVKNRFEAGTVSNFEVLRAEVALANGQPDLITARNDYRLSIEELRQSLGFTNHSDQALAKSPEFIGELQFTPITYDLKSSLATAREQRPDLQRLRKLEDAAEQGIIVSRSNYYPDVGLFGSYDWRRGVGPSASFSDGRNGWTAGVSSTWSIFDGRSTAGRVAQSKSRLAQSKLSTEEAELAVDVDVRRSISNLQQASELAEASKKVVEQAEEAERLANARFSAGTATQLDVLQTQVALTDARLNQLRAYYTFNVAVVTLRRAMGLPDELITRSGS